MIIKLKTDDSGLVFASCTSIPGFRVTGISLYEVLVEIPEVLKRYYKLKGKEVKVLMQPNAVIQVAIE